MGLKGQGVYKDSDPTLRRAINSGYIIIPNDVDRNKFIEMCLRLERFSIYVEGGGGVLHNCYITKSALRDVEFPAKNEPLGSGVAFFTDPYSGKAVIIGVVGKGDETSLNQESTIVFKKTKDGNYALLSVDGNGQINIDIIGTAKNGKLNINVRNDDYSAEVNVHVKGNISLYTEGNTTIEAVDGTINLKTNKDINIASTGNVNIDANKTILNSGDEPMVKGSELEKNLIKTNEVVSIIQDALLNWVPVPKDGGLSLKTIITKTLTGKKVGIWDDIKSKKAFLK